MSVLKKIIDFYINSSIHVSLAVVSLCLVTGYTLNISPDFWFLLFIFCSAVTGYNFVKYAAIAGLHHRSLANSLRAIQLFSFLCALGMGVIAFQLRGTTLLYVSVLGLCTVFYAVPLFMMKKNLRSVAGLKVFVIALVWAGTTVMLPVVENGLGLYKDVYILAAQRFLFVLALMIPFEIRDMAYDKRELYTVPQYIGIKKAKLFGVSLLVAMLLLIYFMEYNAMQSIVVSVIISLLLVILITLSRKRQPTYFASLLVEGIPIIWWVLLAT